MQTSKSIRSDEDRELARYDANALPGAFEVVTSMAVLI